ncbi:hypothetical protein GCM10022211_00990 [Sphingomonas humi]|uniref:Ice-binding protein C-terminal domain-containing protein n=1 Tax=Sphingomonas humi TaxID=335630 RepID=A0ABP7RDV8_9SPHN
MNTSMKLMLAGAALLATTPAYAATPITGQISISGLATPIGSSAWNTATGVDYQGQLFFVGAGTGSFTGVTCSGSCGTLTDIPNLSTFSPIANFMSLTVNGIQFDLNNITSVSRPGSFLNFEGTGVIRMTGFDATPGTFSFSAQGNQLQTFSAAAGAVPEPGTWALMLVGFGAIGFSMRRRRATARFLPQAA